MMAVLKRVGGEPAAVYPLTSRCILGRAPTCHFAALFQDDTNVSRVHAEVEREGNQYFIEDQGSRNGTFVNGQKVHKTTLCDGDTIEIGPFRLELAIGEP